jgi:hypothetical protein
MKLIRVSANVVKRVADNYQHTNSAMVDYTAKAQAKAKRRASALQSVIDDLNRMNRERYERSLPMVIKG